MNDSTSGTGTPGLRTAEKRERVGNCIKACREAMLSNVRHHLGDEILDNPDVSAALRCAGTSMGIIIGFHEESLREDDDETNDEEEDLFPPGLGVIMMEKMSRYMVPIFDPDSATSAGA